MLTWRTTDPSSCFQKTKDFWALTHVFRGSKVLDPGSCFQKTKYFWALAHVFKGSKVLDPGSSFQRPRIFRSWLMFSKA